MKEPLVSKILKIALHVIFVLGVVGTVTLPWMLDFYMIKLYDAYFLYPGYRTFITVFLMLVAALCLLAIWELMGMMRTIPADPFVPRNVSALRRIGYIALMVAALFIGKCFYYVTFLTLFCGLLFVLCALVAFTLSSLFRQAVVFKEENDLTI